MFDGRANEMLTESQIRQREKKSELGQFFTPGPLASFMASMFMYIPPDVQLIDAGAGFGALTAAFVSRCCAGLDGVRSIDATLYELDTEVLVSLQSTMAECELRCKNAGIRFSYTIHAVDFIQDMSVKLIDDLFNANPPKFNIAIANPPYRKISTQSSARKALRLLGIETSNLYTGFIAVLHRLLTVNGQLVAITPRSFCNGPYFKPFREDLLQNLAIERIHIFDSRQAAFRADSVLQENIIYHAVKGVCQSDEIAISSSSGELESNVLTSVYPFSEVVHSNDPERFIHIPSTDGHSEARDVLQRLSTSLEELGLSVSTGRVVDFKVRRALRMEPNHETVPLIYPSHFNGGTIHWPRIGGKKPNGIIQTNETSPWLIPSELYLLTKRFTSKEERRRIVACLFDPEQVHAELVGFENHLNYFHANGHGLDRKLALGLLAYLNSTVVDQYFRRFSGHTQVNATDLRTLMYPDRETLDAIGDEMRLLDMSQIDIDQLVSKHLYANQINES